MEEKKIVLLKKFMKTFAVAALIFSILPVSLFFAYLHAGQNPEDSFRPNQLISGLKGDSLIESIENLFSGVNERVNFILLATDEADSRTDTIIVGSFNSNTNAIDLISVPRDTYVVMPKERRDILLAENRRTFRSDGVMRLNEVHHHAGSEHGIEFAVLQVEELLGISIEYYAKIDLEAFRYIVDSIGGVEFDVPRRMKYDDPIQNLHIDLQSGLQILTGKDAEGLVRFRQDNYGGGYAGGDIERVKVQQDFVKALLQQVVSKDNILGNAIALVSTYLNYVETNFNISDVPKYLPYLSSLNMENVSTHTLPGTPRTTDKSYWMPDEAAIAELVELIFYSSGEITEEDSFDKNIVVLNGSGKSGIAADNRDMLEQKGYTVQSIGDHNGQRTAHTRIVVRKRGFGKDLQELYEGSQIVVDSSLNNGIDIQIILGRDA